MVLVRKSVDSQESKDYGRLRKGSKTVGLNMEDLKDKEKENGAGKCTRSFVPV